MSMPRYYWDSIVKKHLTRYRMRNKENTLQNSIADYAITKALEETRALPDGEERVRLIELLYFRASHSQYGAAMKLHISRATAQRWNQKFIYLVGKYMGYKP